MTQALPNRPLPDQELSVADARRPMTRAGLQAPAPSCTPHQPHRAAHEGVVDAGELEYASWITPQPH